MPDYQQKSSITVSKPVLPWYRQFWPWFIIALPASAVVAGLYTFWLAASNPDQLVVDEEEYRRLNSELKAQAPVQDAEDTEADKPVPRPD